MTRTLLTGICLLALCTVPLDLRGQTTPEQRPSEQQLEKWLEQYPQADTNHDGKLTVQEAEIYRKKLIRQRQRSGDRTASFRKQYAFATMSDGIQIALAIGYPADCDPQEATHNWPAIFEMMGYPDSTVARVPGDFGGQYVTVRASVRGSGASGGTIYAVSPRTGQDGYEVIENWIVKQPWSNGRVALHGHSWGGLTGFMVAATNPPHLKAVAVSGLFDDVYRDIGCIGGIRNSGFPVRWMVNLYKPSGPFDSGPAAVLARGMSQQEYDDIVQARPPWDLEHGILWKSLNSHEYQPEFALASPGTFASKIRAPIHIMHAYQDEQTGPSGVWLWSYIPDDVPKHLVLSNGDHGEVGHFNRQRVDWLNFWTLADGQGDRPDFTRRDRRVEVYFETPAESGHLNRPLLAEDFPLPGTQWTRYYLSDQHQLRTAVPAGESSASDSYSVTVGGSDAAIDTVRYLAAFDRPTAICGPVSAQLWIECTTIDTDLFVMIGDVGPTGTTQLLQRGLLRASHRAIDPARSWSVDVDGHHVLARPRHTHQEAKPLLPGKVYPVEVEIFPVGHVFRQGHQLALWISQPPQGDPVTRTRNGEPSYNYASAMPPATVKVLRNADHPSNILLPILPELPPVSAEPPAPGKQAGIHLQ